MERQEGLEIVKAYVIKAMQLIASQLGLEGGLLPNQ
jgi:hypothetical protein